jgi:hypothetical protein
LITFYVHVLKNQETNKNVTLNYKNYLILKPKIISMFLWSMISIRYFASLHHLRKVALLFSHREPTLNKSKRIWIKSGKNRCLLMFCILRPWRPAKYQKWARKMGNKALWNAQFGAPRFSYLISVWLFFIYTYTLTREETSHSNGLHSENN